MENAGIVPDIISEEPLSVLKVVFPSGKEVLMGNELKPSEVKDQPKLSWDAAPDKYYTLLMTDPDAPKELSEVKHWLVVNIKGGDVASGEEFAHYIGSGPPKGSGTHRYIFFVFEQKGKMEFDEPKCVYMSREHRLNLSTKKFVEKHGLGRAVAGNFFRAQWEPYVDEYRKKVEEYNKNKQNA